MRSPEHDVTNQNVSNFTMLIRKPRDIKPSEITDKGIYLKRREFIKTAAALSAAAVTGCGPDSPPATHGSKLATVGGSSFSTSEELTPYKDVTTYNNFYDFGTQKTDPAQYSRNFTTRPWTVAIDGQVNKPNTYDIDELWKLAPLEERVYRLRCIEAWSMVVPWIGYSLSELIKQVVPTSRGKYVEFHGTTIDHASMQRSR